MGDEVVVHVLREQEGGIWSRRSGARCCRSCSRTAAQWCVRGELHRPGLLLGRRDAKANSRGKVEEGQQLCTYCNRLFLAWVLPRRQFLISGRSQDWFKTRAHAATVVPQCTICCC